MSGGLSSGGRLVSEGPDSGRFSRGAGLKSKDRSFDSEGLPAGELVEELESGGLDSKPGLVESAPGVSARGVIRVS